MHRRLFLIIALMLLVFPGCKKSRPAETEESAGLGAIGVAGEAQDGAQMGKMLASPAVKQHAVVSASFFAPREVEAKTFSAESKIIKTAHLEFQVNNIETSKKRVSQLVNAEKGYIANLAESNDRTRIQASFTIRVPANSFDSLVENILKEGIYVSSSNIERKDVTEDFLDIKARMETQKALEARYREILRQARNVEDILKVEASLSSIREQIEAKEGRLKYLAYQSEYSTIEAMAYQPLSYAPPPKSAGRGFFSRLASSLADGWTGLVDFSIDLLSAWPAVIIFCFLCFWIARRIKQRRQRKLDANNSAALNKI
jgi:hypothetical protein